MTIQRKIISHKFEARRKELGYTMEKLHYMHGISPQMTTNIEKEKSKYTRADMLSRICKALEVEPDEISEEVKIEKKPITKYINCADCGVKTLWAPSKIRCSDCAAKRQASKNKNKYIESRKIKPQPVTDYRYDMDEIREVE